MSWQSLKEQYERFKRWQREPIRYVKSEKEHRCSNCGFTFTGHYCPTCSQRAGLGRIGWNSVHQSVMDVWGLGSRTIVNSVWQLLFRPGYFISDYISGKRQMSFPPMKMLFILAVAYAIVFHWLFPDLKGLGYGLDFSEFGFTADQGMNMTHMSQPFYDWYETHFGWSMLILSFILIFPTWVMFHYSPRHTRHSLPEGFFIQVLFTDLQLGLFLLFDLLFGNFPKHSSDGIHFACRKLHDLLLFHIRSPHHGHGLPHQPPRLPQSPTTRRLKASDIPPKITKALYINDMWRL